MFVQLSLWVNEKMLTAQDLTYDEARNLHSKWLKHQAFMAELQANKEWLEKIEKVWRMERRDGGMIGRGGMREREREKEGMKGDERGRKGEKTETSPFKAPHLESSALRPF